MSKEGARERIARVLYGNGFVSHAMENVIDDLILATACPHCREYGSLLANNTALGITPRTERGARELDLAQRLAAQPQ